jgi:hypothetical protein
VVGDGRTAKAEIAGPGLDAPPALAVKQYLSLTRGFSRFSISSQRTFLRNSYSMYLAVKGCLLRQKPTHPLAESAGMLFGSTHESCPS